MIGWVIPAWLKRAFWAALAGVAAGLAVMAGSFAVWDLLAQDGTMLALAAIDLGVSAALMAAVVAAGSPPPRDD